MTEPATASSTLGASLASHYFAADRDAFWVWSPDLDTIVTRQGTTIAFYQEVVAVLRALVPEGFPAFDAVALFLAGCRDETALLKEWRDWATDCSYDFDVHQLHQALLRFHFITSLFRTSADDKAALAAIVFENTTPVVSKDDAARIVSHLESRSMKAPGLRTGSAAQTVSAFDDLMVGLNAVDASEIEMRLKTGIGTQLQPAELPALPPSKRSRKLLQELQEEDDELSGLASVALDLMAAVHIPRAIDEPENLPLGGYSDISNRGAPDRLLLTELAQDDDVLAVRVNMNEALYLRREAPPRTPQRERTILVDTGIRLWGVPRVFATALGLALCATANERQPLRVFRPSSAAISDDATFESADFFSREGLTEHLGELATSAHPGPALRNIVEQYGYGGSDDLIIVTHPDALADPEFQRTLEHVALAQVYVAVVDAAGTYELWLFSRRGKKRLQRAECRLESILNPGSRGLESVLNPDIDSDLPIALRMREFPLLASQPLNSDVAAYHPDIGLAVYLRDGRVVLWEKRFHGCRTLYCPIDRVAVAWIWIDQKHQEIWLVHDATEHAPRILTRISLNGAATVEIPLELDGSPGHVAFGFHPEGYLLCALDGSEIVLYSPKTGQKITTLELSEIGRVFGRYVEDTTHQWHILAIQNSRLTSELIPTKDLPKSQILRCFDRDGNEGTHVILANGSIFRLKPEPALVHKMPIGVTKVRAISRDGHRVMYVDESGIIRLLDLNLGRFDTIPPRAHHPLQLVEKDVALFHKRLPSLRKNFRAIALTRSGALALITRTNQVMVVSHLASQGMVNLKPSLNRPSEVKEIAFTPIESPFGEYHSLSRADCEDGTRIYLDSRGYLHIVPGDPTLPQVALVTKDGMLSGWFSDGAWFGDRYFIGDRTPIDSASAYDRLTHCFRNLEFPDFPWT